MSSIINISNPGLDPVEGDWIEITHGKTKERKQYHEPVAPEPEPTHRTRLRPGEVMSLLGSSAFAKLHRAAYPQGAVEGDDMALYFLEQAKRPYSTDGMIEMTDPETVAALTYFRDHTPAYITQEDMDRILQGVAV